MADIIYLDLGMGAAGDMLSAALLELHPDPDAFLEKMNRMGLDGAHVFRKADEKCGIAGTHLSVLIDGTEEESEDVSHHGHDHPHELDHDHEHGHDHHHHHASMDEIRRTVSELALEDGVKEEILEVYRLLAEAEGKAHGKAISEIHFHEVGTKDAIMDIAMTCELIRELGVSEIYASPVHVGAGHVKCAHGIMLVPAPATAFLLTGIPTYSTAIEGELCTPTGAALLKHFVKDFIPMPLMRTKKIGYGMGKKEFAMANCVRALLGEEMTDEQKEPEKNHALGRLRDGQTDAVVELSCNIDDMTGEEMGAAMDVLLNAGAKDVCILNALMKKCRPGFVLHVLCAPEDEERFVKLLFSNTTTIGVRRQVFDRYILKRNNEELESDYGSVHYKRSEGYGVSRRKLEYDDVKQVAKKQGQTFLETERGLNKFL